MRVYADTCVYRDKFEGRPGKWLDSGDEARKFFNKILDEDHELIISDHLRDQIRSQGFEKEFEDYIQKVRTKGKVVEVKITPEDKKNASAAAKQDASCEYEDALHAELALKGKGDVLVTRNVEHFGPHTQKISVRFPEHFDLW